MQGVVHHYGTAQHPGMGIEFIHFPHRLHLVYAKFIKVLPILEEARHLLQELSQARGRENVG